MLMCANCAWGKFNMNASVSNRLSRNFHYALPPIFVDNKSGKMRNTICTTDKQQPAFRRAHTRSQIHRMCVAQHLRSTEMAVGHAILNFLQEITCSDRMRGICGDGLHKLFGAGARGRVFVNILFVYLRAYRLLKLGLRIRVKG